jgi:serine/threonine-protein kinase RsbW
VSEGRFSTATRSEVALSVPADSAYLTVVRTAAAGLGARLDFTLDDIEDLRIAVDEACALLLRQARPETALDVWFSLGEGSLAVKVAATCDRPSIPSRSGFSWTVLAALTDELDMEVDGSTLFITLSRSRGGTDW